MKYTEESQTYLGIKKPIWWFTFDGNIRYDAFKDLSTAKDDLWMTDLRLDVSKMPIIQPYIAARHFQAVEGDKPSSGWFVWLGVRRVQDLGFSLTKARDLSLAVDVSIAHSDGALSREPGWVYSRLGVMVNVPVGRNFTISPQLVTQFPLDTQGAGYKPYTDGKIKIVWGISVTLKF